MPTMVPGEPHLFTCRGSRPDQHQRSVVPGIGDACAENIIKGCPWGLEERKPMTGWPTVRWTDSSAIANQLTKA
ncbi:hypothetical protein [Petrachloros mirabilis]